MSAQPIDRKDLRRLTVMQPQRGRVLSVFLDLDPRTFATPAARSTAVTSVMTEAARRVEEAEDLDHEEREALKTDLELVREALNESGLADNGTRGVAVYACSLVDLLEVVSLRRPVESRVVVDRTPHVEPLVDDADQDRWVVLLTNRRTARVFAGSGADLEETDRIEDEIHSQQSAGGWSQARFERSAEKDKADHLTHAADVAFTRYKRFGFDHLVLGAPEELMHEIEEKLHSYLQDRVVGHVQLDIENSTLEEVKAASREAIEAWSQTVEREALDRLQQGVGSGGRGAAGVSATLAALNEARVEILLLAENLELSGQRDTGTGLIYADGEAPEGSELEAADDLVEAAVEKAIEQAAKVITVRHHDDLGPLGGMGAVLRY